MGLPDIGFEISPNVVAGPLIRGETAKEWGTESFRSGAQSGGGVVAEGSVRVSCSMDEILDRFGFDDESGGAAGGAGAG
jgi:hypothetical protein